MRADLAAKLRADFNYETSHEESKEIFRKHRRQLEELGNIELFLSRDFLLFILLEAEQKANENYSTVEETKETLDYTIHTLLEFFFLSISSEAFTSIKYFSEWQKDQLNEIVE